MRPERWLRCSLILLATVVPGAVDAQRSLAPESPSGRSVSPVYEGWYRNKDGTYSLSFGYYNRNTAEVVEVPLGPDNQITGGPREQLQPTTFAPRRHWGVFVVRVPADFGKKEVVWTLKFRGETTAIPGSLNPDWQIDALEGEASADNTPPTIVLGEGAEGQGPAGVTVGPMKVAVGAPLQLAATVRDDGKTVAVSATGARTGGNVDLTWFKHQGPGAVTFTPPTTRVAPTGGAAATTATFSQPGSYVVRVRVNDSPVAGAGHSQCCWTNGFIRVTVTP